MAKLVVEINVPLSNYDALVRELEDKTSYWYSDEDGDKVVIDEGMLERAECDALFFVFKLLAVRP